MTSRPFTHGELAPEDPFAGDFEELADDPNLDTDLDDGTDPDDGTDREDADYTSPTVFDADTGLLTAEQRYALVCLLADRYVSPDTNVKAWRVIVRDQELLRSRLHELYLELVIDTVREVARKVQIPNEDGFHRRLPNPAQVRHSVLGGDVPPCARTHALSPGHPAGRAARHGRPRRVGLRSGPLHQGRRRQPERTEEAGREGSRHARHRTRPRRPRRRPLRNPPGRRNAHLDYRGTQPRRPFPRTPTNRQQHRHRARRPAARQTPTRPRLTSCLNFDTTDEGDPT